MSGDGTTSTPSKEGGDKLTAKILELCAARGPEKSICPSEVARDLEPDEDRWRSLMKPIRRAAARLAEAGRIEILKKGKRIDPAQLRGVIRLRIASEGDQM